MQYSGLIFQSNDHQQRSHQELFLHLVMEALYSDKSQMYTARTFTPKDNTQASSFRYKKIKDYIYDMQTVLGKGNFSTVYRGRNQRTNEEVAVKVVKLTSLTFPKLHQLLEQEIAISRILNHPNTIKCFEVLKSPNHCYFITQLCEGGTLYKQLKKKGKISQQQIWPFVRDLYEGLKYLASINIVHRDLKAANIFLKNGVLKIADFGFSVQSKTLFKDNNIGSPLYMSPEGFLSSLYGPKTDVWAFGLIVYQLIHGKAPLSHVTSQQELKTLIRHPIRKQQFSQDISSDLREMITKCLEVNQKKRISIEEIENLPYFRKHKGNHIINEIKFKQIKNRCLSAPSSLFILNQLKPLPQITETLLQNQTDGKENINMQITNKIQENKPRNNQETINENRLSQVNSSEIQQNTSILMDYRDKDVVIANITFNESIGLIHYCRIGFKLAQEKIPAQIKKQTKSIILMILEELKFKINAQQITYVDLDSRQKKETKLNLVVNQYLSKYTKTIKGQRTEVLLPQLQNSLQQYLNAAENDSKLLLETVYLTMLFLYFTTALLKCIRTKDYTFFGQSGRLDVCLQKKYIPTTLEAYGRTKKQYDSTVFRQKKQNYQ